jgi:hypothetical protein
MYDQDATGDARACRQTKDMYRENSLYSNSAIDPAMHNVPRLDLTRCAP